MTQQGVYEYGSVLNWINTESGGQEPENNGLQQENGLGSRRRSPIVPALAEAQNGYSTQTVYDPGLTSVPMISNNPMEHESYLVQEIESLRQEIRRRDQALVSIESHALTDAQRWEATQASLSLMDEKYRRLLESHRKLNKLNQDLEDKLLSMACKWDGERSELHQKITSLNQRLDAAKLINGDITAENDDYRSFFTQKFHALPNDIQENIRAGLRRDRLKNWPWSEDDKENGRVANSGRQKSHRSMHLPLATFPPTALMLPNNLSDDSPSDIYDDLSGDQEGAEQLLLEVKINNDKQSAPEASIVTNETLSNLIINPSYGYEDQPNISSRCRSYWKLTGQQQYHDHHHQNPHQVTICLDEATQTGCEDLDGQRSGSCFSCEHRRNVSCPDLVANQCQPPLPMQSTQSTEYNLLGDFPPPVPVTGQGQARPKLYAGRLSSRSNRSAGSGSSSAAGGTHQPNLIPIPVTQPFQNGSYSQTSTPQGRQETVIKIV